MPNHVHLIAVPESEDGLRKAIGEAHRRYTCQINFREQWKGHLWQGRFTSFLMDEKYLLAAARYVELNPVKAGLVEKPEKYLWSSANAHMKGQDDELVVVKKLLVMVDGWHKFLSISSAEEDDVLIRRHEQTGRPLGSDTFVRVLEKKLSRILIPSKGGRPKKQSIITSKVSP